MKDTRTDKELNEFIAEWMGWKEYDNQPPLCRWKRSDGFWNTRPPSYCEDLNAIHDAENAWCDVEGPEDISHPKYRLAEALYHVVVPEQRQPFRATSRERSEALVSVIEAQKVERQRQGYEKLAEAILRA
jgi:hypothetical protein